ncbi:MAG: universal stress protein [Anaerolineales bacterium]|nr:universal stress protein [Anaerolineales bacterium]
MFKKLLLAVDGSYNASQAAKVAGSLVRELEADLWIVTAFDPVPPYLGEPNMQNAINARMEAAEAVLKETLKAVGTIHGGLKTEVLEGPAAEAILKVAKTRQNDLIVMGARGLGTLSGILLGSQSQKVLHHAPCPVLVVP